MLFRDSPILFSSVLLFFFFFFLYDSIPVLSRSPESVPNFPPSSTTQISERAYRDSSTTSWTFAFRGLLFQSLLSELSSRFHPCIFSAFQSHRPIAIPFTLPSCSPQRCSRAMRSRTGIVHHGGRRRFRGLSETTTSDLRETRSPCFLTNRPLYSSLRRDQIFFLLDFYSTL